MRFILITTFDFAAPLAEASTVKIDTCGSALTLRYDNNAMATDAQSGDFLVNMGQP
jgi:hypothetical protein